MKVSKVLLNEISKLSKSDWETLKTNIDYIFSIEEKKRNRELYISNDLLETELNRGPYPIEIEGNKKIASFNDLEAIKNFKKRAERIRTLQEAIINELKD